MSLEHVLVFVIVMPVLATVEEIVVIVMTAWMDGIGLKMTLHAQVNYLFLWNFLCGKLF